MRATATATAASSRTRGGCSPPATSSWPPPRSCASGTWYGWRRSSPACAPTARCIKRWRASSAMNGSAKRSASTPCWWAAIRSKPAPSIPSFTISNAAGECSTRAAASATWCARWCACLPTSAAVSCWPVPCSTSPSAAPATGRSTASATRRRDRGTANHSTPWYPTPTSTTPMRSCTATTRARRNASGGWNGRRGRCRCSYSTSAPIATTAATWCITRCCSARATGNCWPTSFTARGCRMTSRSTCMRRTSATRRWRRRVTARSTCWPRFRIWATPHWSGTGSRRTMPIAFSRPSSASFPICAATSWCGAG